MSHQTHALRVSPVRDDVDLGYYGVPVIHGPHWKWLVIGYFYLGGISGAAAFIAAFWRLTRQPGSNEVAWRALVVSVATLAPCPFLLILDLGRPRRFLNMLRVVRRSSPMSIGTWGLTAFGIATGLAFLVELADQVRADSRQGTDATPGTVRCMIVAISGLTGLFVSGYTGVLLAATAVPLWAKRPAILGPLFLASALASGAAATNLALARSGIPESTRDGLERFEVIATLAKGTLFVGWRSALSGTGNGLDQGAMGYVAREGVVGLGVGAPLLLSAVATLLPPRPRRAASLLASALSLVGVFALRYAVVEGGRRSANDPAATFEMTRRS